MKKLFYSLTLSLLGGAIAINGQTITTSIVPGVSFTQHVQYIDTTGIVATGSGAGQNWDFSGVTNVGSVFNNVYIDPTTTAYASSFPNATTCTQTSSGGYGYVQLTATQELNLGLQNSSQGVLAYSDPEVVVVFPLTLGTTHTDNWALTIPYGGVGYDYRKGTTTITADATGTIKTPAGTFNNSLRLKLEQTYRDSIVVSGTTQIVNYTFTSYSWLKDGVKGFVFNISSPLNTDNFGVLTPKQASYQTNAAVTGVVESQEPTFNLAVFPNPAHEWLNMALVIDKPEQVNIALVNMAGQQVKSVENVDLVSGVNTLPLLVNDLPAGTYVANIHGKSINISRTVVIE